MLNATGVIVHTNLGRAPLAQAALDARRAKSRRLLEPRVRPRRAARAARARIISRRCCAGSTGAEAALVVNNNAAAVLLALAALAEGREVVVSRGELIEIGDGFRIPDVLARSGARLVEVGTTNRTRAADYERGDRAGHGAAPPRPPVELPRRRLRGAAAASRSSRRSRAGTTCRSSTTSARARSSTLEDEPTPAASLAAGADLVCFSGDKLLGGPQAGIVAGRADLVERLRRHPLQRALRSDKLTLAALEGTLALYLDRPDEVPVLRMLREPAESVRARAERLAAAVGGDGRGDGRAGRAAASLPLAELPSFACAVEEELAAALRIGEPPVIAVVRDGRTLLDCRTLADEEAVEVAEAVRACRSR